MWIFIIHSPHVSHSTCHNIISYNHWGTAIFDTMFKCSITRHCHESERCWNVAFIYFNSLNDIWFLSFVLQTLNFFYFFFHFDIQVDETLIILINILLQRHNSDSRFHRIKKSFNFNFNSMKELAQNQKHFKIQLKCRVVEYWKQICEMKRQTKRGLKLLVNCQCCFILPWAVSIVCVTFFTSFSFLCFISSSLHLLFWRYQYWQRFRSVRTKYNIHLQL